MKNPHATKSRTGKLLAMGSAATAVVGLFAVTFSLGARPVEHRSINIDASNWGSVTAPTYGTSEIQVAYSSAELFAGPNKFGSYYQGVLPSGAFSKPWGTTIQIGMNPLGLALTADGRFLITSNDDEREAGLPSLVNPVNQPVYSLSVVNTQTMSVVSQINPPEKFFIGLQVSGAGPYTVWASGAGDNVIYLFNVDTSGAISAGSPAKISIAPITSNTSGYVSNYTPSAYFNTPDSGGNLPPVPSGFNRTAGAQLTFPAGSALSPDGKYLYVACNGDNSLAVIDTTTKLVVKQIPVGYFPYGVAVTSTGTKVAVSNWGVTEYKFKNPTYSGGQLTNLTPTGVNQPDGFYVPVTDTTGSNPKTSSVSLLSAPPGKGAALSLLGSLYEGHSLNDLDPVGDTHPSALAIVHRGSLDVLYVAKANSDSLGRILLKNNRVLPDFDLSPVSVDVEGHAVHGAYPNALAVSPDNTRLYVAEAGINSVAVIDTTNPVAPALLGRIPTGWYPTGVEVSPDGKFLYILNAKGIGEDVNPKTPLIGNPPPTGIASFPGVDSNYIFGSLQQVDLSKITLDNTTVLGYNFAIHTPSDTTIVPEGGGPSSKITHVFFILHENKTFDSQLGNLGSRFGNFASLTYNKLDGSTYTNGQNIGVTLNTQQIANAFATAVNYYSDSEESDAGHQFCASGTATDYTEKTLLVKTGRGLLVNKNFEPEDYPEGGYIFNNAVRHGVTFKDYGAMVRIEGTDTGTSTPTTLNDPFSGNAGLPELQPDNFHVTNPLVNLGDVTSPVEGLGQSYFLALPVVAVLGGNNPSGEPRLDRNYPGYNFNISDQRRAQEFNNDFDRMVAAGTLPQFVYLYQPNDHTGGLQAPNKSLFTNTGLEEVADGDVGLGMVINHIMNSSVYYDPETGEGSAIFITYDDAQSSIDHIHPHRTPLMVVSPYAKPAYTAQRHYISASVVKTEELLLGLPPNNLGDLFATDLRDLFQGTYNGIAPLPVVASNYKPTEEGKRIWSLVAKLDTSAPDRDSHRLGVLLRLSAKADELHEAARQSHHLNSASYKAQQAWLYKMALKLVSGPAPRDSDG